MKVDLAGKVKNTHLPRSKALLPLFEAVINSFQAIEDVPGLARPAIDIMVERDAVLPDLEILGDVNGFLVTDNGVGFTPPNLESFFTSDTQYKIVRGGKGIGRFIWLKAFTHAEIESHYLENSRMMKQAFRFTIDGDEPTQPPIPSSEKSPITKVRLVGMKDPYKDNCPLHLEVIGHRLIEHCLPFFLDPKCPAVHIADAQDRIDLNGYFREHFAAKATQHTFTVGDTAFTLKGLRLHNPHETHHRLLYAANSREVLPERLDRFLPNLQRNLADAEGTFVYLGFVEGEYLDQNVNNERTSFTFPAERDADGLYDEITLDRIRNAALTSVTEDLQPFLEEINTEKRATINNYIAQEAPHYRPLVRYMDQFIDKIPPGASGRTLEVALHEQLYEKQKELKQESHVLMTDSAKEALKPEEYEARINDFLERANELGK